MKVYELLSERVQQHILGCKDGAPWLERARSTVLWVLKEGNRSKRPINPFERSKIDFSTTQKAQ